MFGSTPFSQTPFSSLGKNMFGATQSESAAGADAMAGGSLAFAAILEAATGSAAQLAQGSVNTSIAEAVNAQSSLDVIKVANVYPTGVQLFISIGGALVWAVVNDTQNPNWQNVNDTQNPGWNNLPS